MRVSIVVPAYNEEKRIVHTLERLIKYLSNRHVFEILVVDDGSRDRTAAVVRRFMRRHKQVKLLSYGANRGKGYAVRHGMLRARYGYVLFSDADLSTPIEELEKLAPYIKDYDIVIGSRRMADSSIMVKQPWYRRIPGKVFPLIVNVLLLQGIRDTQCGFKLFRRKAARYLFSRQKLDGFSFDAEMLWLAQRKGFSIKEVGVVWKNDLDSKLHPIKNSYTMFVEVLRVRLNHLKGLYR